MTDTELRELELQIAEQVFGMNRLEARVDPVNRDGEPQYFWGYPVGHDFAPQYARDIAAAMSVLDKTDGLWELMRYPEREVLDDDSTPMVLRYQCYLRFGDKIGGSIQCETAAEAICKAALTALTAIKGNE